MDLVKIVECPRDAWQGLSKVIPTEAKLAYLRKLIEAGFSHLDAVSFVSPKHVPQMADSEAVLAGLKSEGLLSPRSNGHARFPHPFEHDAGGPEIIGIVVNEQGLERALAAPGVTTIGYPYSVSANFRRQNANMSQSESRALVAKIEEITRIRGLKLVVYISMAFGNPFGEPWSPEITSDALEWLKGAGVKCVSLADTVGIATPDEVSALYRHVLPAAEGIELGVHLHGRAENAAEKVLAVYEAGCRRFDGALTGLGGCPFASDELVGNIPTEIVLPALASKGAVTSIEPWGMLSAVEATKALRSMYA
ncbi:MAG: hydroxymethylglutaryl-CoA lyase [Acidobacteriota bacterium]|nr:hydroxymethylglutaryl-CoA lyase [Acidobacteriota bacterium]